MKAAVLRNINEPLSIEDISIDSPNKNEVLVETKASGVCRTDLHYIEGNHSHQLPVILGHEVAGVVKQVGENVKYLQKGDTVVGCLSIFCGRCERCLEGNPALCVRDPIWDLARRPDNKMKLYKKNESINQFLRLSSFAELMLVHENSLVKVDSEIGYEQLALLGCGITTGLGAVLRTARINPGCTVAVVGCGGVGLNVIQGARLSGALRIIAIDTVETKLKMALDHGATEVIDGNSQNISDKIIELTGGGVDYSFDAIGAKITAELAYEIIRPGGTATIVGLIPQGVKIELDGAGFIDEKKIQGSCMGSNQFRVDIPRYIDLYKQGRLLVDSLISQKLQLDSINQAFLDMKTGELARSVIVFD